MRLRDAALATSSPCFTRQRWQRRFVSHLVNPRDGGTVIAGISVSVRAAECWVADALTKIVLNAPAVAERLLARHAAEAFVFTA
jgi:thiamine biosynthesis lipoprotein ApbE